MSAPFERALLVEDERHLADAILIALRKLGISTDHVTTLRDADRQVKKALPDLIVLDLTLPDGDGLDFCKKLRDLDYGGTILMLTARGRTEDRVAGLDLGADDYMAKPFSWEELAARVRALARRSGRGASAKSGTGALAGYGGLAGEAVSLSAELWSRDPSKLSIFGPGGWVQLTPLEFKLANHLMQADGAIISRDELLKEVWGFTLLPKTRTVDHFLGRLRRIFEANPENPQHFVTVRGAGYRFLR